MKEKIIKRINGMLRLYFKKILYLNQLKFFFGAAIGEKCRFRFDKDSKVILGYKCFLENYVELRAINKGYIKIGPNTTIGSYSRLISHDQIKIGECCAIASFVTIVDHNHKRDKDSRALCGFTKEKIIIGNNVWIGEKATILKGITIEDNATIGAGSVVTKNVLRNKSVAGVPAKEISKVEIDHL